jgi:hypothetical protein
MTKLYPISVATKDGSFAVKPAESIEAGLLDGMVAAANWAQKLMGTNVAWTEVTDRFVKGHMVANGERVIVFFDDLPFAVTEELDEWVAVSEPGMFKGVAVR